MPEGPEERSPAHIARPEWFSSDRPIRRSIVMQPRSAELDKQRGLPTPVTQWLVETGPDSTDQPAVWVWAVLKNENVSAGTRSRLRDMVRELVRKKAGSGIWVYVRFRGASEMA